MKEKADRRVRRTKERILETLAVLIEEKGLNGVTVKDLTERADINRGTFYLHYQDKYDLLEKSESALIREIGRISAGINYTDPAIWDESTAPPEAAAAYFACLKQHGSFLKAIMGPKGDPAFQDKLKKLMIDNIKKAAGNQLPATFEYLTAFMVSAHLGVVQHWLETGMKEAPKEMAALLVSMNKSGPLKAGGFKS
ncbi:TetR/AcrR family transcriptional regulator [Alteribacter lacisalsi]|nr:TetR/AcrR family transcriptional regulator [Alteribacter lacisalsi]